MGRQSRCGESAGYPPFRPIAAGARCGLGLAAALRETAAQGAVFSYLYPFSTAFYSRFGYGLGCERTEFRLPVADRLPYPDTGGTASLVEKGRYVEDYRTVYEAFSARYNLMIAREDMDYEPLRRAGRNGTVNIPMCGKTRTAFPRER